MRVYLQTLAEIAARLPQERRKDRLQLVGGIISNNTLPWSETTDGRLVVELEDADSREVERLAAPFEIEFDEILDDDAEPLSMVRICPEHHPVERRLGDSASLEGKAQETAYDCLICNRAIPETQTRQVKGGMSHRHRAKKPDAPT